MAEHRRARRARAANPGAAIPGVALLVWVLGYLVVGVALATVSAWPVFATPRLVLVAAVGLAIGVGAVLLPRLLGGSDLLIPVIAVVAYLAAVVPVAVPSALGSPAAILGGLRDGVLGIVVGWKQLLTLSLPLGEYQAVLVPFFALVTAGSLLVTWLGVIERRATALAAAVVVALAAFGLVFGSSDTGGSAELFGWHIPAWREIALQSGVLLVSVVWLVGRARLRRTRALRTVRASASVRQGTATVAVRMRRQLAGVLLIGVAAAAGLAVAPAAAGIVPRHALRDRVDPYLVLQQQPSPLAAYRSWFAGEAYNAQLFAVQGEDADRLRLATLGHYDGEDFRVASGEEAVSFTRLPGGAGVGGLTITIGEGYRGIWVPVPAAIGSAPRFAGDRAQELADGFYLDTEGGAAIDIAPVDGTGYGLVPGDSYTVPTGSALVAEGFAAAEGSDPLLDVDDHPQLVEWVAEQAVPRTGAGLLELVDRLRARGYLSHALTDDADANGWIADLESRAPYAFTASYSGHSVARIEALFRDLNEQERRAGADADPEFLVAAPGDDEQFAVAVALLARSFGFDSRVVLGVRLEDTEPMIGVPACAEVCTGGNLTVWAEVRSPTGGWQVLDATPQFEIAPVAIDVGEKLPENPTTPEQPLSELLDPPSAEQSDEDATAVETPDPPWWEGLLPFLRGVGTGALALVLLLLPVLVLVVAKRIRRSGRRGQAVPEVSMVGAWSELVNRYVDAGFEIPVGATRTEIAAAVGRPNAVTLAAVVDRAVFGEHPPGPEAARAAWELVEEEIAELAAGIPFGHRLRAALTPRSFLRDLARPRRVVARAAPFLARFSS